MKIRQFYTFGLIVLGMVAFTTSSAEAASGTGGYYATPSWDEKLTCTTTTNCPRFEVLTNWSKEAVLDKETGLIWQLAPGPTAVTWEVCSTSCLTVIIGGRLGWRMPTIQELASLEDPTQTTAPYIPKGSPFNNIASDFIWSATFYAPTGYPLLIHFYAIQDFISAASTDSYICWCVRGGSGSGTQ